MKNKSICSVKQCRLEHAVGWPISFFLVAALCQSTEAASYITFNATFDYGGLGMADQAVFQSSVTSALSFYSSNLQTPSPLTVNILFKADESIGLGQSSTYVNTVTYSAFRAGLVANASSAADMTALGLLPSSSSNPVNGSSFVTASLPLLRALGYGSAGNNGGGLDATVSFKTSIINLDRAGAQDPAKYDLQQVAFHEINEVLGFTSELSGLNNGDPAPTGAIGAADLFRYDAMGNRSFTTAVGANAYFSIDGTTALAQFNQNDAGDFHDFNGAGPNVQDAFSTPGVQLDNAVAEKTAIEVIGYNYINFGSPAPIPEPGSAALIGVGLVLIFRMKQNRRQAA
jgi:hypothetical protein